MSPDLDPVASLVKLPAALHPKPAEPEGDDHAIPLVLVTDQGINLLQVCEHVDVVGWRWTVVCKPEDLRWV